MSRFFLTFLICLHAGFFAQADGLSDEDLKKIEKSVKSGLAARFGTAGKLFFAGPKGLLLFNNCDQVQYVDYKILELPKVASPSFSIKAKLFFSKTDPILVKGGVLVSVNSKREKTDSIDSEITAKQSGEEFTVTEIGFSEEALSANDHCRPLRANSRLIASVRKREIVRGMPESAVFISWGKPDKKVQAKMGITELHYSNRQVTLANGLVVSTLQE
jgi:hypothetical protein